MDSRPGFIIPAFILAASVVGATYLFTGAYREARRSDQTITVTGSSKQEIVSDLGILRGSISVTEVAAADAFRALNEQRPQVLDYLKEKGFDPAKVVVYPLNTQMNYRISETGNYTGQVMSYTYTQRIEVQETDVKKIGELALEIPALIERGITFQLETPEYHYTQLTDLKITIQAEAAKDAMKRAQKIADATSRKLGPLKTARMGVLQITPRNSTDVSNEGYNDLSSIEKEITSVVSASFLIE